MSSTLLDLSKFCNELYSSGPEYILWASLFLISAYFMSTTLLGLSIFSLLSSYLVYGLPSSLPQCFCFVLSSALFYLSIYYFMSSTLLDHIIFYELRSSLPHNIL
jgi:hypothetical protein